jgi:PIN domain nuclease of toxin-antitoxin system
VKLLLGTHIFIWWVSDPSKLSQQALALCEDGANSLVVSVACIWEMQIKQQLGKLILNLPLQQLIANQQQTNDVAVLPIELEHVLALQSLPVHYKDPFDRMLVAQAIVEQAILLSADSAFAAYPVQVLG